MNAKSVVNVLLELNIVNLQDLDREINRLSASLYDPRAVSWFKRVARHWIMNMDWLQRPYEAPAEPRSKAVGGRPSDWYAEPSSRSDLLYPAWRGEQPPNKPNVCQRCKGEKVIFDKEGNATRCPTCGGTGLGEKPYAGGHPCPACRGSGKVTQGPEGPIPVARNDKEFSKATECPKCKGTGIFQPCSQCGGEGRVDGKKCKKCKGTGKAGYEYTRPAGHQGYFTGESLLRYLLDEADGYDPIKRTYTTNLHVEPEFIECPKCNGEGCRQCNNTGKVRQRLARDISQNFQPFNPKKAKKTSLFGDPPAKGDLQPWMTAPAAAEKQFHHFDPIQFNRRELSDRLQNLVSFLNYSYRALKKPPQLSPEEMEDLDANEIEYLTKHRQKEIEKATAMFRRLETMKPDDVNGFREIMMASEEFVKHVEEHPELYGQNKSGKVIARHNDLVLRRCTDQETALVCGRKKTWNGQPETWCLHNDYNVASYLREAPIFYVEKQGKSYVGIHFGGAKQVRNTRNAALDDLPNGNEISEEIAPLFVPFSAELPEEDFRENATHLADIIGHLRHEARRGNRPRV